MPGSLNAHKHIEISDHDFDEVSKASRRLNDDGYEGMSSGELIASAFVNGRLDLLPHGEVDFRRNLIRLGREWSHTVIEVILSHWEREMALNPSEPLCPVGDQRVFTRET